MVSPERVRGPTGLTVRMLTKINTEVVRQPDQRVRRAWYQGPAAEVVLEHDADTGAFLAFEIEWDTACDRRAYVLWGRAVGLRTGGIDTGDPGDALKYKGSPLVLWHSGARPELVASAARLIARSGIEEGLRDAVLARLKGC